MENLILLAIMCIFRPVRMALYNRWWCQPITGHNWSFCFYFTLSLLFVFHVYIHFIYYDIIFFQFPDFGSREIFQVINGVVMTPIAEEAIFRGLFLIYIARNQNGHIAVFLSSFIFAILHVDPLIITFSFIFGLVNGYLMLTHRKIVYPILFHSLTNGYFYLYPIFHKMTYD